MKKPNIQMKGKTIVIKVEVNLFGGGSHTNYSGYGAHNKNTNKHRRVNNRLEEKKAQRGDYD